MTGKIELGKDSRSVVVKESVRVKVPVKSLDMKFQFDTPILRRDTSIEPGEVIGVVPERWHNAFSVGRVLVNRNFYGIAETDLGKTITATVEVYEKSVDDRKYTALNISKETNGTRPTSTLRFMEQAVGESHPIQGTSMFVCFV